MTELGAGAIASWADRNFYGLELSVARRPSQGRFTAALAGGVVNGQAAMRLELSGEFLVNPSARSGVTLYGGLGAAFRAVAENSPDEYLTLLAGVEEAAGRRHGWYVETGFSGGVFARVGYRWRQYPGWWH